MWINLDDFVTISDYAKLINKTVVWTLALVRQGRIPFILHNGKKLIPKSGKLPEYINNQKLITYGKDKSI